MPSLYVLTGPQRGESCRLATGSVTIGRLAGCDVQILGVKISREHCRVWLDPIAGEYMLADLGSSNGTLLNGSPVRRESVLSHADEITIGGVQLRFSTHASPNSLMAQALRDRSGGEEYRVTRN
jgi:pSer/pThr/pTyr-binding forkhead associated (FHA) protein